MENGSLFNLEAAIVSWRAELSGGAVDADTIAELEAHLREATAEAQRGGRSEEEAFAIASYRLGRGQNLRTEFAKLRREQILFERVLWMLLGAEVYTIVSGVASAIRALVTLPQAFGARWMFPEPGLGSAMVYFLLQYGVFAALLIGLFQFVRRSDLLRDSWLVALQRNPLRWCGALAALGIVFGTLTACATLLPTLLNKNSHFDSSNITLFFISFLLQASVLPAVLFCVLRLRSGRGGTKLSGRQV